MSSQFNLNPWFTIVLTRISSVFDKVISRPAFLDSFQRSSNFLCICSYLWDTRHTSSAYSIWFIPWWGIFGRAAVKAGGCSSPPSRMTASWACFTWLSGRFCGMRRRSQLTSGLGTCLQNYTVSHPKKQEYPSWELKISLNNVNTLILLYWEFWVKACFLS